MTPLAVDNETRLISRETPIPKIVCTAFYTAGMVDVGLLRQSNYLAAWWKKQLEDPNILFIGLNTAYDMGVVMVSYPELTQLIYDAYEAHRITDVGIRMMLWDVAIGRIVDDDDLITYSLDRLAQDVLGANPMTTKKDPNSWRLRYSELENVNILDWPTDAVQYAKLDPLLTYLIWDKQNEVQNLIRNEFDIAYNFFVLNLITAQGMLTNADRVSAVKQKFTDQMNALTAELYQAGILAWEKKKWVKKKKPTQEWIKWACYQQGIEPRKTKTGDIATDKVACLLTNHPILKTKISYGVAEKMLTTYIPVLEQGCNGLPITSQFGLAATSRTTSKTPRKPLIGSNFQNAPRKGGVRDCYEPHAGCVYIITDLNAAELHTLAQKCKNVLGWTTLGDALNAGIDVHLYVAAQLLNIPYEHALYYKNNNDPRVKEARQNAKPVNFGFPGGMGIDTFIITQIHDAEKFWPREEVVNMRDAWVRAFPEIPEYFAYCKRELGPYEDAVIELPNGMLRRVRTFPQTANSFFQGGAGAGATAGLRRISYACYADKNSPLYGSRPCNFIHDEAVTETKIQDRYSLHDRAYEQARLMAEGFNRFCPDYPTTAEPVLSYRWVKNAEPVFNEKGELIPWMPPQ